MNGLKRRFNEHDEGKAIRVLKNFLGPDDEFRCESQEVQEMCEAIEVVLSALTPPTQEQRSLED